MTTFFTVLIILIEGFIWITRDIIRVPKNFDDSWFKRFKGNKWIDPEVSWVNKGNYHMLLYPILSMFGDLFHTLGSLMLFLFYTAIYINADLHIEYFLYLFLCFLGHGLFVWVGYNLWRKILK